MWVCRLKQKMLEPLSHCPSLEITLFKKQLIQLVGWALTVPLEMGIRLVSWDPRTRVSPASTSREIWKQDGYSETH